MAGLKVENGEGSPLLENALGFYSWNVQENRVYGDEIVAFLFGLSPQDLSAGLPIEVVIRDVKDGDKQKLARLIHEGIITGQAIECAYQVVHRDGRLVSALSIGRCLRDAEGVPSIYSGTVTLLAPGKVGAENDGIKSDDDVEGGATADPLERHCRAALGLATTRRHTLAARYLSSALNVIGAKAS